MLLELRTIAQTVEHRLESYQALGRTITLKVKFTDYQQITRSKTVTAAVGKAEAINQVAKELLASVSLEGHSVRLLGISLSNLDGATEPKAIQLCLLMLLVLAVQLTALTSGYPHQIVFSGLLKLFKHLRLAD